MNKEVIELTKKLGEVYVKIAKLNAEKHIIQEKIWAARSKAFSKKKEVKKNGGKKRSK